MRLVRNCPDSSSQRYVQKMRSLKEGDNRAGEDIREGGKWQCFYVKLKIRKFEGRTKTKLGILR